MGRKLKFKEQKIFLEEASELAGSSNHFCRCFVAISVSCIRLHNFAANFPSAPPPLCSILYDSSFISTGNDENTGNTDTLDFTNISFTNMPEESRNT